MQTNAFAWQSWPLKMAHHTQVPGLSAAAAPLASPPEVPQASQPRLPGQRLQVVVSYPPQRSCAFPGNPRFEMEGVKNKVRRLRYINICICYPEAPKRFPFNMLTCGIRTLMSRDLE